MILDFFILKICDSFMKKFIDNFSLEFLLSEDLRFWVGDVESLRGRRWIIVLMKFLNLIIFEVDKMLKFV